MFGLIYYTSSNLNNNKSITDIILREASASDKYHVCLDLETLLWKFKINFQILDFRLLLYFGNHFALP